MSGGEWAAFELRLYPACRALLCNVEVALTSVENTWKPYTHGPKNSSSTTGDMIGFVRGSGR